MSCRAAPALAPIAGLRRCCRALQQVQIVSLAPCQCHGDVEATAICEAAGAFLLQGAGGEKHACCQMRVK